MYTAEFSSEDFNAEVDRTPHAGASNKWQVIEPGTYVGVITELAEKKYRMNITGKPNAASPDGKWDMVSLTPMVVLKNDNGTEIGKQDFTFSALDADGKLVDTDGKGGNPVWGGKRGCSFLLSALGLYRDLGSGKFSLTLNPAAVRNMPLRVSVNIGGYIKGQKSYTPDELKALLTEFNLGSPYTPEELPGLVKAYNAERGVELRLKNVITGFYPANSNDIAEHGFVESNGLLFVDREAAADYAVAMKSGSSGAKRRKF